jgi:hypothetical protein
MENNQNDDLDYAELSSYSFVAFHTYSLNMKEIQLLEYKIAPVYKQINEEDKKQKFESLSPKFEYNDTFKEKYNKLIEPIRTYFALYLKFNDKDYFSLFGIDRNEAYENRNYDTFDFLFPFKLDMKFEMTDENNNKVNHNITVCFGGFYSTSLDIIEENSETLEIVSEGGENYLGQNEIKFKQFKKD